MSLMTRPPGLQPVWPPWHTHCFVPVDYRFNKLWDWHGEAVCPRGESMVSRYQCPTFQSQFCHLLCLSFLIWKVDNNNNSSEKGGFGELAYGRYIEQAWYLVSVITIALLLFFTSIFNKLKIGDWAIHFLEKLCHILRSQWKPLHISLFSRTI